ncbi:MAG: HNH endonuclease [Actinomycetota bacterium]
MFTTVITAIQGDDVDLFCRAELTARVNDLRDLRAAIDAHEARLVRAIDALPDEGLDGRGVLRSHGGKSARAANRAARTAHALGGMPDAESALASGRITAEHADVLAKAARDVDPELVDAELVSVAETGPADVFAKRATEWVSQKTRRDTKADHDAQRRARTVKRWNDDDTGLAMFLLGVDQVTGAAIDTELTRLERRFYDDDGRSGDPDTRRTTDQRLADAMVELITGTRASDAPPHPKHNVTVMFDLSGTTTDDGQPLATLVTDGKPLPEEVLNRLSCIGSITPMLFNGPAKPIWVGRDHRTATITQWRALIARDRGCIGCGANPDRCEAHHITPWTADGPTEIDNLALVCSRCHHDIHNRAHTLEWTGDRWIIRPPGAPPPTRSHDIPGHHFPTETDSHHLTLTA